MEQMTAGMISYFLSISKLQASTSAMPAPAASALSPVGSAILGECGRLEFGTRVELLGVLSQVHLSRSGDDEPVLGGCNANFYLTIGPVKQENTPTIH